MLVECYYCKKPIENGRIHRHHLDVMMKLNNPERYKLFLKEDCVTVHPACHRKMHVVNTIINENLSKSLYIKGIRKRCESVLKLLKSTDDSLRLQIIWDLIKPKKLPKQFEEELKKVLYIEYERDFKKQPFVSVYE